MNSSPESSIPAERQYSADPAMLVLVGADRRVLGPSGGEDHRGNTASRFERPIPRPHEPFDCVQGLGQRGPVAGTAVVEGGTVAEHPFDYRHDAWLPPSSKHAVARICDREGYPSRVLTRHGGSAGATILSHSPWLEHQPRRCLFGCSVAFDAAYFTLRGRADHLTSSAESAWRDSRYAVEPWSSAVPEISSCSRSMPSPRCAGRRACTATTGTSRRPPSGASRCATASWS